MTDTTTMPTVEEDAAVFAALCWTQIAHIRLLWDAGNSVPVIARHCALPEDTVWIAIDHEEA